MLTWVQIVIYFLINLPKLISIIKEIIELIKNAPHSREALTLRQRLSDAIAQHKIDKDDEKIKKMCFGVGCPSDLVKE